MNALPHDRRQCRVRYAGEVSTSAASLASASRHPTSLSAGDTPAGKPVVHRDKMRTAVIGVGERDRDRHLTAQGRIGRLELIDLHDQLIGHQRHKTTVIGVGVRVRLVVPSPAGRK
jgi:hypothetical protein